MGAKPRTSSRVSGARSTANRNDPRIAKVLEGLAETWPDAHCELDFRTPFELLTATILSAQCTDRRVNQVTPALFRRYPDAAALAAADPDTLEGMIRSTGFFRSKARHLIAMARALTDDFGGEVPHTLDQLITLPGVARKTANVVLGAALGIASGVAVDTHVKRVANRLHLTSEDDPVRIERDLMALTPPEEWIALAHRLIWHGRRICKAKNPACNMCPLAPVCPEARL